MMFDQSQPGSARSVVSHDDAVKLSGEKTKTVETTANLFNYVVHNELTTLDNANTLSRCPEKTFCSQFTFSRSTN